MATTFKHTVVRKGTDQHADRLKGKGKAKDEKGYYEGILVPQNPETRLRQKPDRGSSAAHSERRKQLKKRK